MSSNTWIPYLEFKHLGSTPDVCFGKVVIKDTRLQPKHVVSDYERLGSEEFYEMWDYLKRTEVEECFEYIAIEKEIRKQTDVNFPDLSEGQKEAIVESRMGLLNQKNKSKIPLIKVDFGPNAGRDYKKNLFGDDE